MKAWGRYGQRLKRARKKLEWSQARFAQAFGITQTAIGKYEKGERIPAVDLIEHIKQFIKGVERATEQDLKDGIVQYRIHRFTLSRECLISREKKDNFSNVERDAENQKCLNSRGDLSQNIVTPDISKIPAVPLPICPISKGAKVPVQKRNSWKNGDSLWITSTSKPIFPGLTCSYCHKIKPDEEITIDDSFIAKYICEDCYRTERTKGA